MPLVEAKKAVETLRKEGLKVSLIDIFSVKPIDHSIAEIAKECKSKIVVFEETYRAGNIFEALSSEFSTEGFSITGVHVTEIPCSG